MLKLTFVHLNRYIAPGSTDFYELTQAVGRLLPGGVDVFVADEPRGVESRAGSVNLHSIPVATRRVWTMESVRFYHEAARQIVPLAPDVVSVTFDRGAAAIPGLVRRQLGNKTPRFLHHVCSVSFAESSARYRLSNWLTRLESSRFDAVTTLSPDIAREIYGRSSAMPIDIVPIGVNLQRFKFDPEARAELRARHGAAESDLILIYVGTLGASKHCDDLVSALGETGLDGRGMQLWIVGDGPQKAELENLARRSPLGASIRFFGSVPYEQVPRYLAAADLGISHFPSASRHALQPPIKVLEYLACSLPVLATDVPGNRFYLKDGYNAMLYPADGRPGLAAGFRSACDDRERITVLRPCARASAVPYDWDQIAADFVERLQPRQGLRPFAPPRLVRRGH